MSVTYIRVRTTAERGTPAACSASNAIRNAATVCAYASPGCSTPSGPVAVVPAVSAQCPARTTRQ